MKKILFAIIACCTLSASAQRECCGSCDEGAALRNIMSRTSIRQYKENAVPDTVIEKLLRAAMAAPTAVNRQPWHFVVVTNVEVLEKLGGRSKDAPLAVIVCGDMDKALEREARDYWVQDCSAATENLLLAAHAMGLGAVWQGVYPINERVGRVSEIVKLNPRYIPLNVIAIGYPDEKSEPKDKWKPGNVEYIK